MSQERPDQWYLDALERKQQARLFAAFVSDIMRAVWWVGVLVCLAVIAWKVT